MALLWNALLKPQIVKKKKNEEPFWIPQITFQFLKYKFSLVF